MAEQVEIVMADSIVAGPPLILSPGLAGPLDRDSSDSLSPPPPPPRQPHPHRPHASHDFLASGSFDSPSPTTPSPRSVAGSPRASPGLGAVGAAKPSGGGGGSPGQSPTRNPVGQPQSNRSGRWNSNTLAGPSGSPPRTSAGGVHTPSASVFDGSDAAAALLVAVPISATPVPAVIPAPAHPNHTSIDFSAANAVPLLAKANAPIVRVSPAVARTRKILLRWLTKSALRVSFSRSPSTSPFGYLALKNDSYRPFYLAERTLISSNTVLFRFALPSSSQRVGLPVGKHMLLRCLDAEGKVVSRPYTPVSADEDLGHFDLLVKLYPTGKMSQHLSALQVGQTIEARGPQGSLEYKGQGVFSIMRRQAAGGSALQTSAVKSVGMIAGGSGITPMVQLLRDVGRRGATDHTKLSLIFANVTEADILMRAELEALQEARSLTNVHYTLDRPADGWTGSKGFVTLDMIKANLPPPADDTLILLCGPKPMVDMMEKNLLAIGYTENMYFKY